MAKNVYVSVQGLYFIPYELRGIYHIILRDDSYGFSYNGRHINWIKY